jgi:chromosome segregation ATPase
MRIRVAMTMILAVSLTACATSSDPRQGGLFGYNPKAYDVRLGQRRQELAHQQNISQGLTEQSSSLDNQSRVLENELAIERQRLNDMQIDLSRLESKVNRLQTKSAKQEADIASFKKKIIAQRQRLDSQESEMNKLERAGGRASDPERYQILEQERNLLAEEYKKLLDYSQALANAAI